LDFNIVVGGLFKIKIEDKFALINKVANGIGTKDISFDSLICSSYNIEITFGDSEFDLISAFGRWIVQLN
jgi:hypothetical protein